MRASWRAIGLGLGANLGDPPAAIRAALAALETRGHVHITVVSSLFRTKPWGPVPQPDYANSCALASTDLSPRALLDEVKAIEVGLGRRTGERWGPRAIDIDILFYEGVAQTDEELIIPHKSLLERAFVLVPLAEIAPDLVIAGQRIAEAAAASDRGSVIPWAR